jgi:hypothetical protein
MFNLNDYTGVIHVHSVYSFDGRISVPDILEAGRSNGIDFVMLTDHSTLRAREEGFEGWRGNILLVIGQEIAPRFNHYLAFQINTPIIVTDDEPNIDPRIYMNQVKEQGGIGFIAHPDHGGTKLFHVKHYPWSNWTVTGYTGIGIWDFMTDWQSTLSGYIKALFSFVFPAFFLTGPKKETLQRWDQLNQISRVVGIGELDNHDTMKKIMGLNFSVFPFKKAFKLVRTHVITEKPFTGDDTKDIELLMSALKRGRVYVAQEYYREAKGFSFILQDNSRDATMGDEFELDGGARLTTMLPATAKIRIIRNGTSYREEITHNLTCNISKEGVYRVEAYLKIFGKYLPWIFSNHIYVNRSIKD